MFHIFKYYKVLIDKYSRYDKCIVIYNTGTKFTKNYKVDLENLDLNFNLKKKANIFLTV